MVAPVAGVTPVKRGPHDVAAGHRRRIAHVGEEIAGEQRAGGLLVEQARVPAVRHVRGVEAAHAAAAQVEDLVVGERARGPRRLIVEPDRAADGPVGDGGRRRGVEPFREGSALVGLDVAEGDPAQPAQVHDAGRGGRDGRVEGALAAVEEQGLVRVDQELVEGEALRTHRGQKGREPVDPLGNLVDTCLHRVFLRIAYCSGLAEVSRRRSRSRIFA